MMAEMMWFDRILARYIFLRDGGTKAHVAGSSVEWGQAMGQPDQVAHKSMDRNQSMTETPNRGNERPPPEQVRDAPDLAASPLSGFVQDAIGRSLQAHFDDIVNSPVPDKFLLLLAELEAKERRHEG
jgi:Anti-sigma factor NepR